MDHSIQAAELFLKGYNCSQAVVLAYGDVTGLDPELAARLASSFGGGMGRLREVCGAVSGMFLVAGYLYGYTDPDAPAEKKAHYQRIQELAAGFRAQAGSIVCRELLKDPPSDPAPTPRTAAFYQTRPCTRMVMLACQLLDQYIQDHPIPQK